MNTAKKLVLGLTMVSALGVFSAVTIADIKGGDYRVNRVERLAKKLDLTEQQTSQIKTLIQEHKADVPRPSKEQFKEMREQRRSELHALFNSPEFDEQAVREKIEQRHQKYQTKMVKRMKLQHAIYQTLNPEQQEKYLKMVERRMGKHKRGKKHMRKHHEHSEQHDH